MEGKVGHVTVESMFSSVVLKKQVQGLLGVSVG